MPTIYQELDPTDAAVVAGLRESMAAQKGKFAGVAGRAPFEAQKRAVPPASDVEMEPGSMGGVPGWWCHPPRPRRNATLIYYHGGWYMLGTAEAFRNQASHFAALTSSETFVPDYRRAPEAPFPAAYDDALAVYIDASSKRPGRIALVGDSVGGALALMVLAAATSTGPAGGAVAVGAVAMSPVMDLTLSGESMQTRADADPIFTREMVVRCGEAYLDGADPRDARASPLLGEVHSLPPIRIDVGDQEILLDDALRYAARAEAAGVDVTLGVWAGMPHTFQGMIGRLGAATRAIREEADFLNRVLSSDP